MERLKMAVRVSLSAARWLQTLLTLGTVLTLSATAAASPPEPTQHPQVFQVPLANGFVHLSFHPSTLHVPLGETRVGSINVSIDDNALQDLPVHIHQCCEDRTIATLVGQGLQHFVLRNQTAFLQVVVRGAKLGRTSLKFYVAKNSTAKAAHKARNLGDQSGGGNSANSSPKTNKARDAAHRQEANSDHSSPRGSNRDGAPYSHVNRGNAVTAYTPSAVRIATLALPLRPTESADTGTARDSNTDKQRRPKAAVNQVNIEGSNGLTTTSRMAVDDDHGAGFLPRTSSPGKPFFGQNNLSLPEGTEIWWITTEYEVTVSSPLNPAGPYLSYAVMILVGFNLLGVGAQVDGEEIVNLLKKPLSVTVGFFCRFAVIPAIGLGIVELMQPSAPASLGVLGLTCSPAEGASTLLVLLAELDLTFSVTLTTVNNFATIGMIPLWTIVFENRIYDTPGNAHIPFREILVLFGYMTCSLALGVLGRKKCPSIMFKYWTYLPSLTVFTIVFILIVEIYNHYFVFSLVTASVFFQSALLALCGFVFSAAMAFIARQSHDKIAIIAIETGTRTTYITTLLLSRSLEKLHGDVAKTAPVLCAFLSLLPTFFVVLIYRMLHRFRKVKYAATTEVSYLGSVEDVQELFKESEKVDSKETAI